MGGSETPPLPGDPPALSSPAAEALRAHVPHGAAVDRGPHRGLCVREIKPLRFQEGLC